jgi:Rieske Fe-S protein
MKRRDLLRISIESPALPKPAGRKLIENLLTQPSAGYPRDYARNIPVLILDVRAWLIRDELGFYAIDAMCPHLGSIMLIENGFCCSCHGSTFAPDGTFIAGRARQNLRFLRIDLDTHGKLVIQRHQAVSPDDRFIA